jgi:hypothetical protein
MTSEHGEDDVADEVVPADSVPGTIGRAADDDEPGVDDEPDAEPGVDDEPDAEPGVDDEPETGAPASRRRQGSIGQTIGGVLFGFEQQVLRTMPPPQELVHHARPDAPIPAGDGSMIHVSMPGLELPDDGQEDDRALPAGEMDEERAGG